MQQTKKLGIGFHIAGWILFFCMILAFITGFGGGEDQWRRLSTGAFIFFVFTYVAIFYLNSLLLIPRLYFQKQFLMYGIVIILLLVLVYWLRPFDSLMNNGRGPGNGPPPVPERPVPGSRQGPGPDGGRPHLDIVSIILFLMTWSFSTAVQVIRQWRLTEKKAIQAETEKVSAELSFLKAQINPHFLFNTLNNIYSMAVSKSDHTPTAIMKLSNIMRYVTDEIGQELVPLQDEINCAADYIDLQRMRLSDKVNVDFSVSGNTNGKQIAPLILMTFIENVFKYGTSNHEETNIIIRITAEDKAIHFYSQNKIFNAQNRIERAGIGIENTRKRLERIYPGRHRLEINSNGIFTVQLDIQL